MSSTNLSKAKANAKKIGYDVKFSTRKGKKLDVFDKDNNKVGTIGAIGYTDFLTNGGDKVKQKSYLARHKETRMKKFSNSWFAWKILWT